MNLTEEQAGKVRETPQPVEVLDPGTQRLYVLLPSEQYEWVRHLLEGDAARQDEFTIPSGIRRSQEAFWRDLPQLLTNRKQHGWWVCYCGEEQLDISRDDRDLIRECLRRGLADDGYYLARIHPHEQPPWEPEEIEALGCHHLDDCLSPSTAKSGSFTWARPTGG